MVAGNGSVDRERVSRLVEKQIAEWRSQDSAFPWHIVAVLVIEVVSHHPDVVLVSNEAGNAMLRNMQLSIPYLLQKTSSSAGQTLLL